MYVVVVGAGEVGSYIAERLSREGHDVAIVEIEAAFLRQVEEELDVLTVPGSGTHPEILKRAGIAKADLLVAVTNSDETNLVTSLQAKEAGVGQSIARIQAPELRSDQARSLLRTCGVDLVIDPDEETAEEVLHLLDFPGASEVALMADGEVTVIGVRLPPNAPLAGYTLSELARRYDPEWEFLIGLISRGDETIIPRGDQRLQAEDLLRIVCRREARRQVAEILGLARQRTRRVLLLGGGRTAEVLAGNLRDRVHVDVVLIERNPERARELADRLHRVLVLVGEITDASLLEEADIGSFDAVIALTGEDDANILASLYAKSRGVTETIAVVHRLSLLPLLSEAGINAALSPRRASANAVLRLVRGGVSAVTTFLQGEAEVIEIEIPKNSLAEGVEVKDLSLPKDVLIGAIVRDGKARIARGTSVLRSHDRVVLFAMPKAVAEARRILG